MSKYKSNFVKYLAFCYPYISIIIYNIIIESLLYFFSYTATNEIKECIFVLINMTSLIFGINVIKNYNHKNINSND